MSTKTRKKLNVFRLIFLITLLAVLVFTGVFLGLVVVSIRDMPRLSVEAMSYNAVTLIYDQDNKLLTKIGTENRIPIKIEKVPEIVKKAFIATEDVRFYQHHGIDFRGIARAAWQDLTTGSIKEGASTITQQVVRDIYLTKDREFKRKIQEIVLAMQLERALSKDEILELYLNNIYFGEGAYGIQTAAETYFGKPVEKLTLKEGAFLAGLPQAPTAYSPYSNSKLALKRRNIVLRNMLKYNFINSREYDKAARLDLGTLPTPTVRQYSYPYYMDYVTDELIKKYGEAMVFKGGLRVHVALDRKIQTIAQEAMANNDNFPNQELQGAVVILDPHTGYIRALVGGREHTQKRQWNRATQTYRQPGSTFKPIIAYGPAIEINGLGPATVIDDTPVTFNGWSPRNSSGGYRGLITMRKALTNSVNTVAVKLLDQVTIPKAKEFARKLKISSLDPKYDNGLSMALGGLYKGVTPLELAGAYGAFANQGIYTEPTTIVKVEKSDGTILEEKSQQRYAAMKPTTAYLITDMLESAVNYGTGKNARLDRPVAGKTGTTDEGKDIWFAGYTPELLGVVWMGYDLPKAMPYEYGGTYPALLWRKIMSQALESLPIREFPQPSDIVTASVDNKSGLLPGPNTPSNDVITDKFSKGTVPHKVDTTHVLVEICATSGKLANSDCPDRITKVMLKLPYSVPDFVADYDQRVPKEICTLHGLRTSIENSNTIVNGTTRNEQVRSGTKGGNFKHNAW